jgi:hypothetical protein
MNSAMAPAKRHCNAKGPIPKRWAPCRFDAGAPAHPTAGPFDAGQIAGLSLSALRLAFNSSLIGTFRLALRGGIGDWNHFT